MPRLQTSLLRHARTINPLLPILLQTCRTIPSAHNELRWLREHVDERLLNKFGNAKDVPQRLKQRCVVKLALQRGRGVPLQYILGNQPFGDLVIKCEKGVLIPRQCTEAYTERLAQIVAERFGDQRSLGVIDYCTGTGCIPLLLLHLLEKELPDAKLSITGVEISPTAISLAKRNAWANFPRSLLSSPTRTSTYAEASWPHTTAAGHQISFLLADVLKPLDRTKFPKSVDIITANPPYISLSHFNTSTERSVRNYEPRLALVPGAERSGAKEGNHPEDIFYHFITAHAASLYSKMLLFEVEGSAQAFRIAELMLDDGWEVEIWGDDPTPVTHCGCLTGKDFITDSGSVGGRELRGRGVRFVGEGDGRAVVGVRKGI